MANSYNPKFTLTLQGCYETVMFKVVSVRIDRYCVP